MVGILMGSESDREVMEPAEGVLKELGVEYEVRVMSAHRTPEKVREYAKEAEGRGIKVLIAGAGGAAALPGVIASYTILPVIGVPIASTPLGGQDSLYSIVQMPSGVPVATVGINNAKNAALLAAEIIAVGDGDLARRVKEYRVKAAGGAGRSKREEKNEG